MRIASEVRLSWVSPWRLLGSPWMASSQASDPAASQANIDARPFPREFTVQGTSFNVHQPQFDSWEGNQLKGRFAMSVKTGTHSGTDGKAQDTHDYGVVQFQARTEVDKEARAVVLTDLQLPSASFPTVDRQAGPIPAAGPRSS